MNYKSQLQRMPPSPRNMMRGLALCLTLAMVFGTAAVTQAALLQINLTGIDIDFNRMSGTPSITDRPDPSYDTSSTSGTTSDTGTFKADGTNVISPWMTSDNIRFDMMIADGSSTYAAGNTSLSLAGTNTNEVLITVDDGTSLRIQLDTMDVVRTILPAVTGLPNIVTLAGSGTVVDPQVLPDGMKYAGPVGISYTSVDAFFNGTDEQGSAFNGVLTITGQMVPEPTSMALLGLGLTALVVGRRRQEYTLV